MEATASDPTVQQQFGMTVGIPNAGQVRALGMLNIRGERSVTCKATSTCNPRRARCRRERRRSARISATSPMRSSGRPSWTRIRPQSRPRGDADVLHPVLVQGSVRHERHAIDRRRRRRATTSIFRRAITCWSSSCATRARSSTPRPITEYNGRAGNPGGKNKPDKVLPSTLAISAARGPATRPIRTTRRAPLRSARAPVLASRSAPIW